jgi:hypothetical protein
MAKKLTKTQKRRLVHAVFSKSRELYMQRIFSTKDVEAIEKISMRAFNKLK